MGVSSCLLFDGRAEEAMDFYVATFRRLGRTASRGETFRLDGRPLMAFATLDGQAVSGLNGGPPFPPTPAFSFSVACRDQAELDAFWAALSEGGEEGRCGWLTDRFGVSWQVVPERLPALLAGDPARAGRVMAAVMGMRKLDIAAMEAA